MQEIPHNPSALRHICFLTCLHHFSLVMEPTLYQTSIAYSLNLTLPFQYLFFFLLGAYLSGFDISRAANEAKSKFALVTSILALAGASAFLLLSYHNVFFAFPPAFAILFILLYKEGEGFVKTTLAAMGKHSLVIYLVHWAAYIWLFNQFKNAHINLPEKSLIYTLLVLALALCFAVIFSSLYEKAKKLLRPSIEKLLGA